MADGKFYSLGPNTLKIPLSLYAENRQRLCNRLNSVLGEKVKNTIVVLQGGDDLPINFTDVNYVFRQESFFNWAFGVREPGFYGTINVQTGRTTLFIPQLPEEYAVWMGRIETTDDYKEKYQVDAVHFVKDIADDLKKEKAELLLTLKGVNSDSGLTYKEAHFDGIDAFNVDNSVLYNEMSECRLIKTKAELEVMRYVNKVSSEAHKEIMKTIKPGMMEYQAEATFLGYCYNNGGCRHCSYTCICGSGENGAILHYGHAGAPNEKRINGGDMLLFDMGAEYCGYDSDITCSFPANGVFTNQQKIIYNAVLKANRAVIASIKPGVSWPEMHLLANRVMLKDLKEAGLVVGEVDDMMGVHLAAVFQPHGLGHLLGLDTHDVGGYIDGRTPERLTAPGLKSLRTARNLEAGMCLTVEPGCYFNDYVLEKAYTDPKLAKFLVKGEIDKYKNFGGVRIEDNIVVTDDGCELITDVPRTIEEIEEFMAKK